MFGAGGAAAAQGAAGAAGSGGVPTISGTAEVGETLTASGGAGGPWQWYRDAVAISGETGATLDLTWEDEDTEITVEDADSTLSAGVTIDHPYAAADLLFRTSAHLGVTTIGGAGVDQDDVTAWEDQVGGVSLIQTDGDDRPVFDPTGGPDGEPILETGSAARHGDSWLIADADIRAASGAYTVAMVVSIASTASENRLLDIETGRDLLRVIAGGQVQLYDGSTSHSLGSLPATGPQVITMVRDGVDVSVYIGRTLLGSVSAVPGDVALTDAIGVCAGYTGSSPMGGWIADLIIYDAALDGAERTALWDALEAYHPSVGL